MLYHKVAFFFLLDSFFLDAVPAPKFRSGAALPLLLPLSLYLTQLLKEVLFVVPYVDLVVVLDVVVLVDVQDALKARFRP